MLACPPSSSAARATGFWVLACSCADALSSRCARAVLALRSHCTTHTPASGEPEPWAVHDDGGSSPSSALPSCCHCVVIIHANSRSRALALARVLSLAHDDALATLALRSHSRPFLVALQRFARLPAPPFARAALSLASRAPSPHPRPSLPRSSAATSARLRRALRSISSTRFVRRPARGKGARAWGIRNGSKPRVQSTEAGRPFGRTAPTTPGPPFGVDRRSSTYSRGTDDGFP